MATNNNSSVGSTEHIVKTTKQWAERAMEYYVIPRGCLCVELTTDKKIKLKVGEGNKFYKQLPYVHEPTDLTSYYTKNEILQIIRSIEKMTIKSVTVYDDISDLPSINNEIGDVRFVKRTDNDDPDTYVWVGKWRMVGAPYFDITKIDFVNHEELTQVDTRVKFLEDNYHNHYNKDILDLITQPYTVQDKEKLDSLFNYDDTLIKQDIANVENKLHNHDNKTILDGITKTALWSSEDRTKFKDLKNYDDTDIKKRLDGIEKDEHTHENKEILDKLSQQVLSNTHTHENKELLDKIDTIFTREEKEKLSNITSASYKNFVGTDGLYTGMSGLVPAPKTSDAGKVLSSSGEWITPPSGGGGGTTYTAGNGISLANDTITAKLGTGLSFDENGNIQATGGGTTYNDFTGATASTDGVHGLVPAPLAGEEDYFLKGDGTWDTLTAEANISAGDGIRISQAGQGIIVTDTDYYFDTQVQCSIDGRTFTKYNSDPAIGAVCYTTTGYTGPVFFGLTQDSVKMRQSHDSSIIGCRGSFEYMGQTWYYSNNGYQMAGNHVDSLGNLKKLSNSHSMATDADMAVLGQLLFVIAGVVPSGASIISVNPGTGLMFDTDGSLRTKANAVNYNADDGIEFTLVPTPPTVDDWTAANVGYYFNNQVECYLSRRYKKTYEGPAICCVMNMIRNGNDQYDMFLVSPVLRNVTFECDGHVFNPSSSQCVTYKGLTWYYSNWEYAWGGSGYDTDGHLLTLPLSGVSKPTTFEDAALMLLQTADVIGIEHGASTYGISAKIGNGLQIDSSGAIEVTPQSSVLYKGAIVAGPGIQIIPPSPGITASYLRLEFGSVRDGGSVLEVQRISITDNNSQAVTFSAVTDTFADGTTPQYGNSGSENPQAMINGTGKMCCVNFGSSRLRLTLTLQTPICIDDLNSFSYLTGVYESGFSKEDRDPMSWYIYASADGTTWTEIMNVPNGNVTTSRNTWITPEPFMIPTSPSTIRVSDSYINSLIEEYIRTH